MATIDPSVTAYSGKEVNSHPSMNVSQKSANTQAGYAASSQALPYNTAVGPGPIRSVIQSAPGARTVGTSFSPGMSNLAPVQPRNIRPHENIPHDRLNQTSPTQHDPLSTDLQHIMQNLPPMSQPPPPIRNPRSQQSLSQYIGVKQPGAHEIRSSPTTQIGAAFQIGHSLLDYQKPSVQQTVHNQHHQTQHQSSALQFPAQISNPSLFHDHKQAVGQPFNPTPPSPPIRPTLTSSRSAGNIPTVAETLFGEQGLAATRDVNPLASIFSQQNDSGKYLHLYIIHKIIDKITIFTKKVSFNSFYSKPVQKSVSLQWRGSARRKISRFVID